nr:hypothetical protein [Bacillota bacterium]
MAATGRYHRYQRLRHLRRYREIATVLARHGLTALVEQAGLPRLGRPRPGGWCSPRPPGAGGAPPWGPRGDGGG